MKKSAILARLFWEELKISALVVGGGYAIVMVADVVFGRRLKWLEENELLKRLPIFQTVPGLIASNSAVYVGVRVAGTLGGLVAVVGMTLPSFVVISLIASGYDFIPMENRFLQGAFIGLRSAMCGIIIAAIVKSWRNAMRGVYAWLCLPAATAAMFAFGIPAKYVLLAAILLGLASGFRVGKVLRGSGRSGSGAAAD
jgi:Chromate transport protein ChrA